MSSKNQDLAKAVAKGDLTGVKQALLDGANPNFKQKKNWTMLTNSVNFGFPDITVALLEAGAKVDTKGFEQTALIRAAYHERPDMIDILVGAGADVNAVDEDGWTALITAVNWGNKEIVCQLLKAGANVDISDNEGWTPLMHAVCKGYEDIIFTLVSAGADINTRNSEGQTAMFVAVTNKDEYNFVWKHSKKQFEHTRIIDVLMEIGVDIYVKDNKGKTVLDIAVERGYNDIVRSIKLYDERQKERQNGCAFDLNI